MIRFAQLVQLCKAIARTAFPRGKFLSACTVVSRSVNFSFFIILAVGQVAQAANQPPIAFDKEIILTEGDQRNFSVQATGYLDGPGPVTSSIVAGPTNGVLIETNLLSYQYTPNPGFSGTDTFTWTVNDGEFESNIATGTLRVNMKPVASGQSQMTLVDQGVILNLTYDDDNFPGPYVFAIQVPPVNGTLTEQSPGVYLYQPASGYSGTDFFQWSVNDGLANSNWARFDLLVEVANQPPVAIDREIVLNEGSSGKFFLQAIGLEGPGPISVTVVTLPANGALIETGPGKYSYTPNPGFSGTDAFTWSVNDGEFESNVATGTFTVNMKPIAIDQSQVTGEDQGVVLNLSFDDDNFPGPYAYTIQNAPGNGTLTEQSPGVYLYQPASGYSGTDFFRWSVNDGAAESNWARFNLSIQIANQPPVAIDREIALNEGSSGKISLQATGLEGPGPISVTVVTTPANGTLLETGPGKYTYTPNPGFFGTDSFTWSVNDGEFESNVATGTFTVNMKPIAIDQFQVTGEDQGVVLNLSFDDDGFPGPYAYTIQNAPGNGTLTEQSPGVYLYQPASAYSGTDFFRWSVNDGAAESNWARFNLSIQIANQPPIAVDREYVLTEGTQGNISIQATGISNGPGPITVTVVTAPTNGLLVETGLGTFTYTPDPGFFGTDFFTWSVNDGEFDSNVATATFRVNKIPVAHDFAVELTKDQAVVINLTYDDDSFPGPYVFTIQDPPNNGTLTEQSPGVYLYQPASGYSGMDVFWWSVNDGLKNSSWARVDFSINEVPVAQSDSFSTLQDHAFTNWLNYTDDDFPGNNNVTVTQPAHGTVTILDPNGRFEYTPGPGYTGPDQFTWSVNDGQDESNVVTLFLDVYPYANNVLELGIAFPLSGDNAPINNNEFNSMHFNALNVINFRYNGGNWGSIEPVEGGAYDWISTDSKLIWALNNGYSAFLTVPSVAPAWECDPAKTNPDTCVPLDMNRFQLFVEDLMDHLASFELDNGALPVHMIAFGNEWTTSESIGHYPGSREDFETQMNIVYDAVHNTLPGIPVATGGLGSQASHAYAICKGYIESATINRDSYCLEPYALEIIDKTEYVLQNARYDVLDQHLYDTPQDFYAMVNAVVNEALPANKKNIPIVVSEMGGPHAIEDPLVQDEIYQAEQLGLYIDAVDGMNIQEALYFTQVEGGDNGTTVHRYSGLIDRDKFDIFKGGGSADIEKPTYWEFQDKALLINAP